MSSREPRASVRQIERVANGRTIDLINYEEIESGAHGTRMGETPESPHTMPAVADPQGENVFDGDFGSGTSYELAFLVPDPLLPDALTDSGSKEAASRVKYEGDTYVVETINDRFPAGFTILGCDDGEEP